jgi:vacuolar-type H+-ATPase subunit I/STV1
MWGRVLAVSGGPIILVFTVALWYSDHQKNVTIISNWQKDYNSLLTDRGNVNIQNVQLNRQNRQLVYDKEQLSAGLTVLNQKIDTLSIQIDQLIQANELAASDLAKERKINKNLLDESGRLRQESERCEPN